MNNSGDMECGGVSWVLLRRYLAVIFKSESYNENADTVLAVIFCVSPSLQDPLNMVAQGSSACNFQFVGLVQQAGCK